MSKLWLVGITALLVACSGGRPPISNAELAIQGLHSARISSDGSAAIVGSLQHGGSYWKLNPAQRLFNWNHASGEMSTLNSVALSPDGQYAFSVAQSTMVLWSTSDGSAMRFWQAPAQVLSASISNETDLGVIAALAMPNGEVVIYNASRGRVLRTFKHVEGRVRSVAISSNGAYVLSGGEDNQAIFWDVINGRQISVQPHADEVQVVALSKDSKQAFSFSRYDKALLWNTDTGRIIGELDLGKQAMKRGRSISSARFSNDGKRLLTGGADRNIELWDVASQTNLVTWQAPKRSGWLPTPSAVLDVAFVSADQIEAILANGMQHRFAMP